ncbi:hypothetical protein AB3N04_00230 (plasmid) [Alkalihalophilus sp. As8PL]|uniref:Uncharacterized protein n=1 Tax=Alkalihalophilus sp. As8PL TaxID=3237103 RepID=A0AB39BNZ4_9BACI
MGEYIWLLVISIGFCILFHYFDKKRMPKKAIAPSVLILFALLAVSNYIKGTFF